MRFFVLIWFPLSVSCAPIFFNNVISRPLSNPNCTGTEQCPVWPSEFSAPFGLNSFLPYINNATSFFYYKNTDEIQAQVVDYVEHCTPFTSVSSFFSSSPCKLYFNYNNVYLQQPERDIVCCELMEGVGPTPPAFLTGYELTGQNVMQKDMYGRAVSCDQWDAGGGFMQWTVGRFDSVYGPAFWGRPIAYQEGPVGVIWRWGQLQIGPQSPDMFRLPASFDTCSQACPIVLGRGGGSALQAAARLLTGRSVAEGQGRLSDARRRGVKARLADKAAALAAAAREAALTAKKEEAAGPAACRSIQAEDACEAAAGCRWCTTIDLEWCQLAGKACKE